MSLSTAEPEGSTYTQMVQVARRGHRHIWWSTSQALARCGTGFAWDVRGYYRALGVPFPYVGTTQAELSRAYMRTDGQSSAWATYSLKQLLNREVRRAYDAAELGEVFWDRYLEEETRDRHLATARGTDISDPDAPERVRRIIEREQQQEPEDTSSTILDNGLPEGQDEDHEPASTDEYPYGIFLGTGGSTDPMWFAQWQTLLIQEAHAREITTEIALGSALAPVQWTVGESQGRPVVMIDPRAHLSPWTAYEIIAAIIAEGLCR